MLAFGMIGAACRAGIATLPSLSDNARPRPVTPVTSRLSDVTPVPPPSGATMRGKRSFAIYSHQTVTRAVAAPVATDGQTTRSSDPAGIALSSMTVDGLSSVASSPALYAMVGMSHVDA